MIGLLTLVKRPDMGLQLKPQPAAIICFRIISAYTCFETNYLSGIEDGLTVRNGHRADCGLAQGSMC